MDKVFKIVRQLEKIRNNPQFIFIDSIYPTQTRIVREKILEFCNNNSEIKEIDFILESPGGLADDSYRIIRTLRKHFEKVNIIVPFWAKSAATLLALGGSTIIMDEFGEFGPLDTQLQNDELPAAERKSALIDEYSLKTIEDRFQFLYKSMMLYILNDKDIRIKKSELSNQLLAHLPTFYSPILDKIDAYEIGAKSRALAIGESYARRILIEFNGNNIDKNYLESFVDYLVHGCPHHGYILDFSLFSQFLNNVFESKKIGIDYCSKLTELSILFFDRSIGEEKYIGFCPKEKIKKIGKKKKKNEK